MCLFSKGVELTRLQDITDYFCMHLYSIISSSYMKKILSLMATGSNLFLSASTDLENQTCVHASSASIPCRTLKQSHARPRVELQTVHYAEKWQGKTQLIVQHDQRVRLSSDTTCRTKYRPHTATPRGSKSIWNERAIDAPVSWGGEKMKS